MFALRLIWSAIRRLPLCVAAGLHMTMASSATAADEGPDPARFGSPHRGSYAQTAAPSQGPAEYAITGSGAIVPIETPETPLEPGSRLSASDNFSNPALPPAASNKPGRENNLFNNSINLAIHADDHIGVPGCGPSPLEPEAIRTLVAEAATRHGVEQSLAEAVVAVESSFDRERNSRKGAREPMQLMPATAERFGVPDPCEPAANIDAGVRYLGVLLEEFGNPLLAIAAYNAGEARIYKYGGIPPFPETVSYVAKVVNRQLGLPVPRKRPDAAGDSDSSAERGVIVSDKRRQWIAGVMQF